VFADIANDMKVEATCLVSTAGEAFLSRHIPAKGQRIISLSSASITAYMDIQAQATYVKIVSDVEGSLIGRFPIASIITADSSTIAEITNKMAVSSAAGCHVTVQAIAECAMNLLGEVSSATTLGSESLMDCPIGADLDFVSTLTGWLVKLISGEIFTESTTTPILLGEWQLSGSIASATFLLAEAEVTYSPVTAVTVKFNTKEELTVELELENMVEVSHTEEDFAEALMKLEDAIDVGIETETSITADFITEITVTGKLEQIKSVDSLYYPLESQSLVQVISEVNLTSELTKEDRKEANIITSISTKGGN
jgi:hypothetical protein